MASYSILIKETPGNMKLVREGFSFGAFLLGPVWFSFNRMWLAALISLLSVVIIIGISIGLQFAPAAALLAIAAVFFVMAIEAPEFRRASLVRRGYRLADIVESHSRNEAEIRFLARRYSLAASVEHISHAGRVSPPRTQPAVGLFLNGT